MKRLILIASLAFGPVPSCLAQAFYFTDLITFNPGRINTAGFSEAREFKFNTSSLFQGQHSRFSADLSLAVLPGLALGAGVHIADRPSGKNIEIQLGHFGTFDNHFRYELFAGYGNSSYSNYKLQENGIDTVYTGWDILAAFFGQTSYTLQPHFDRYNYTITYHRFFFQPALNYSSDYFSIALGFRASVHQPYKLRSEQPGYFEQHSDSVEVAMSATFRIQPFVNIEAGPKYCKLNLQAGVTSATKPETYLALGATVHIASRFDKNKRHHHW